MLNETQSILYHWTTPERMMNIAKTKELQGTSEESDINRRLSNSDFNICFSRNRNIQEGYVLRYRSKPNICLLTFDSTYINGKIKPFDFYSEAMFHGDGKQPDFTNGRMIQTTGVIPARVHTYERNFFNQSEERLFPIGGKLNVENCLTMVEIVLNWKSFYNPNYQNSEVARQISNGCNSVDAILRTFEEEVTNNEGNISKQRSAYHTVLQQLVNIAQSTQDFTTLINTIQRNLDVPIVAYRNFADFQKRQPCDYREELDRLYSVVEHIIALKPYFEDKELINYYDVDASSINRLKQLLYQY